MNAPSHSPLVPIEAQVAEAEREYKKRLEVFPRWVEAGKITQKEATHRLQCQLAIVHTLQLVAAGQRLI